MGNTKAIVAIGLLGGIVVMFLLVWRVQADRMGSHFVDAMRDGTVDVGQVQLQGKVWTEAELATTVVIKLDSGYGRERSVQRSIHTGGQYTISRQQYAYQAMVTDADTGIKHVFGYRRAAPQRWQWEGVHPDSMQEHIRLRQQQVDQMHQRGTSAAP